MPLLASTYEPPSRLFQNGHYATVYPRFFREVEGITYRRERIETPDGDFLDLDWMEPVRRVPRVAVLSHGLEASSRAVYIRGMARALFRRGWDVLAWNYRGCSGEPNRLPRFYHSGSTDDLDLVVRHALDAGGYREAALLGFSLGGNMTLKYLGEHGQALDPRVRRAVAFSVPVDLAAGAEHLAQRANTAYMLYFLRSLRKKVRAKMEMYPEHLSDEGFYRIRSFRHYDDRYTAPLHGFRDAEDYWARCSSARFLDGIRRPTLLVNAADDPFLPPACYPVEQAAHHRYLSLEVPEYGGHVAFVTHSDDGEYWSERRAADFLAAG